MGFQTETSSSDALKQQRVSSGDHQTCMHTCTRRPRRHMTTVSAEHRRHADATVPRLTRQQPNVSSQPLRSDGRS